MCVVKDRIRSEGHNLGGGILMVDGFINYQFDPDLIEVCRRELAARFAEVHATKVLHRQNLRYRARGDDHEPSGPTCRLCPQA